MKSSSRSIICEQCKRRRQTAYAYDICSGCTRKLEKKRCSQCSRLVLMLEPGSANCRRCVNSVSKVKIICECCGLSDYAFTYDLNYCRKCHPKMAKRNWVKSLPKTIVCLVCGAVKSPAKKTEMVCQGCNNKRRNANVKCLIPGCDKQINNKTWQLCKHHDMDRLAPVVLREYLESYTSPFPQNQRYMTELASTIKWGAVDKGLVRILESDVRRFRAIGDFLKTHELPEVLTWEAIDEALPKLGKKGRPKAKFIRSYLLHLGHLAAERGSMQDRKSYLTERLIENWAQSAPESFRKYVSDFQEWSLSGMLNPRLQLPQIRVDILCNTSKTLLQGSKSLVAFLTWCVEHSIISLPEIEPTVAEGYQHTLFWQFECKSCHKRIPFEPSQSVKRCANRECGATSSYVRVRRHSRSYVRSEISNLRVFFNWAQLHDIVSKNPFSNHLHMKKSRTFEVVNKLGEMMEVESAIRHYDDAKLEKLCAYIVSPNAEPEEALVLYLIIFHLFTPAELCNVKIPSLVNAGSSLATMFHNKHDYEYLYLPLRKPTRGDRSTRRPKPIIKFPRIALSWLVPLLERYYKKRKSVVCAEHHEYLLAVKGRARYNKPVIREYVLRVVQRASGRVLGGSVNPRDLQRTAAAVFARRSRHRGAVLTMMGYSPVSATQFNYLETFTLQPKMKSRPRNEI